jgi:hypothetical protein
MKAKRLMVLNFGFVLVLVQRDLPGFKTRLVRLPRGIIFESARARTRSSLRFERRRTLMRTAERY